MVSHTRSKRRHPWIRLAVLLAVLAAGILFFYWSNHSLQIERFTFLDSALPEGFDGAVVVQLSDLHCGSFGENNSGLLSAVAAAEPDYIFLTGDLLDQAKPIPEGYVETLAGGLAAIAPTYYVTGNHEWARGGVPELKNTLADCGVTVLSNQFVPLERQGDVILLAGIDDPNGYADQKTPEELAAEIAAAGDSPYWLLLAHRNTLFADRYSRLGANLTICGHGGSSACPLRTGSSARTGPFSPPIPPGSIRPTGRGCSCPGVWGTAGGPSACSTGPRWWC